MLRELHVADLGVIADLTLSFEPGLTAITGETGAGKTLVVEAIELLVGGRADAQLVRQGAAEARVEGRFEVDGDEVVAARVIARGGRSRAYVDGGLAAVGQLSELGARLVDLHGQHSHQSLLHAAVQRAALDAFGRVDLGPLAAARARVAEIERARAALGGDPRARAREIDLLRFQLRELDDARLEDAGEDARLEVEEDALADADAHRRAGHAGLEAIAGDGGATDATGAAVSALAGRGPFGAVEAQLRAIAAELAEAAADLRRTTEAIADDPDRLDAVRARRRLLRELCRKYGDTLTDVLSYAADARDRLAELESHDARAVQLDGELADALGAVAAASKEVAAARRRAAPGLAAAVEEHLHTLALPHGRMHVEVTGEGSADEVRLLLAPNPGEPALPLAKVASGGELARTMLALRLVLTAGPPTLVFDEVDAGIGGEAALAVGRALARLARDHQVLVVTHLPHVAAFADQQVAVTKDQRDGRTVAAAAALDEGARVVELSRMLSGQPGSRAARVHAEELLAAAAQARELAAESGVVPHFLQPVQGVQPVQRGRSAS